MANKQIIINQEDYKKMTLLIRQLKKTHRYNNNKFMRVLAKEMENAHIGDTNPFAKKYVTLNSKVKYKDLKDGNSYEATIVFPVFADSTKDLYSILSPLGTALIGEAVGNITTCYAPAGELNLEILEVETPVHRRE